MAANEGDDEKKDGRAGRDRTGPAKGRKPRPSGDRLVEHGRGGAGGDKPRGGKPGGAKPGGAGHKRADAAEARSDRAARPDRPRTAKPPVTRNDGVGSKPARPRRDLDAKPGPGGDRKPWAKDGPRSPDAGPRKPRPAEGAKPWRKDADRPARPGPGGDRKPYAKDRDRPARPPRDGDAPRKPWSEDGPRPARSEGAARPASDRKPWSKDGPRPDADRKPRQAADRKPWAKDGERPTRPARDGERKPWAKDGDRPARGDGAARPTGDRKPWSKDGPRPDRTAGQPARDGDRARPGAAEKPKETKGERTVRLRQDTSVSLRKGGQKGRGLVKPKKAPSTKRMRKPDENPKD